MTVIAREVWRRLKLTMGYRNVARTSMELELQWLVRLKPKEKIQRNGIKLTLSAYIC